jgi:hypothetical protein
LATETLLKLMKRFSLESKDDTLIFMIWWYLDDTLFGNQPP